MNRRLRVTVALLVLLIVLVVTFLFLSNSCPLQGISLTRAAAEEHQLKNRTTIPLALDFDHAVSLAAMLQPGNDQTRWSQHNAAAIEGYVVSIGNGGIESANCYVPCNRDTHINLALRVDAPSREQVVVEVTPRMRTDARSHGRDWSTKGLTQTLVGRWCRFEGWLYFDAQHANEATNTAAAQARIWRATAWELHPITNIEIK
ncbi:MAG: hypothetical protein ABR555_19310 [Pyrinomonadaceae bacterium]